MLRVQWLKNGLPIPRGITSIVPSTQSQGAYYNVSLQLTGLTTADEGVYSLRVTLLDGNGDVLFEDTSQTSRLTVWGGSTGQGSSNRSTSATVNIPVNNGDFVVRASVAGMQASPRLFNSTIAQIVENSVGGVVTFDLSELYGVNTVRFPRTALEKFTEAGLAIEARLPLGRITLDADAINSVLSQGGAPNMSLGIYPDVGGLTIIQRQAMQRGERPFRILARVGNNPVYDFEGIAEIAFLYEGPSPAIWQLDDFGVKERMPATTFTTSRLNLFLVGYDYEAENDYSSVTEAPALPWAIPETQPVLESEIDSVIESEHWQDYDGNELVNPESELEAEVIPAFPARIEMQFAADDFVYS